MWSGLTCGLSAPVVVNPLRIRPSRRKEVPIESCTSFQGSRPSFLTPGEFKDPMQSCVLWSQSGFCTCQRPLCRMCYLRNPQGHRKLNPNALPSPGVTEPQLFLATPGHSGLPGIDRASCSQSASVWFCSPSDGGAVFSLLYRWEAKAQRASRCG